MGHEIINEEFLHKIENMTLEINNPMDGLFGGGRKSDKYGSTVEFADYREYVPGDEIRRIDWNVYGRFEKLYIKLFADERQIHNQIIIDGSKSMKSKGDKVKQMIAALGYLSVLSLDRVSLKLMKEDKIYDLCGVISGKDSFINATKMINEIEFSGDADIKKAVMNIENPGYADGITFIVSDFLTDSDYKAAADFLIYRRREVVLVQMLTPEEIDPGYGGRLMLLDSEAVDEYDEKNMKLEINKSAVKIYQETLKNYLSEIQKFCNSRGISFVTINCEEPIEKVLFRKGYERGFIR